MLEIGAYKERSVLAARAVAPAMVFMILLTLLPWNGALAGAITVLAPVADADQHLGLCDVLPGDTSAGVPWTQLAYNAGARSNRWEFRWDVLEPQPGQWNFTSTDPVVAQSRQAGLEVLGVIDGTPRWAVAPGQPPGNGVPRDLARPIAGNRNVWASFIRGLVTHYRGQIGYWEIWNEPDLHFFWNGNADDYVGLLRVAYRVIKQADPSAQVMLAGMVVPDMQFFTDVLQNAQSRRVAGKQPFDLAAWHAYGASADLYPNLLRFRGLLELNGSASTPVWVTEDGFPASNPAGEPRQAAYILQTIAYALAAGAARVLVYRASDDPLPRQWGTLTAAGAPRMSYVAFQVAAEYLAHTQAASYVPDGSLERFVFYQPTRRVTVFWNRAAQSRTIRIMAGHPQIDAIGWQGLAATLRTTAGEIRLQAPSAIYNQGIDPTNAVVAGPPRFVVEDNVPPVNLRTRMYLPAVYGDARRIQLLNPADSPVDLVVSALDRPLQRQVVHLPPKSLITTDLDLLGGIDYVGMYAIAASGPVVPQAASTAGTVMALPASPTWYLATVQAGLTVHNPGPQNAVVDIVGYGRGGQPRVHAHFALAPGSETRWASPDTGTHPAKTLIVHSSVPVVLFGTRSDLPVAAPSPRVSWYVVHPAQSKLAIFNPSASDTSVQVRLIAAGTVRVVQIRLGSHRSVGVNSRGARAVVLTGGRGVVVANQAGVSSGPPPSVGPETQGGLTVAARVTRVNLFNPAVRPAYVTLRLVVGAQVKTLAQVIPAQQIRSVPVRTSGSAATGVIFHSDLPVILAPG